MRAVTIVEGELEWKEHPDPVAGDTELLVSVKAAGVNAADLMQAKGHYPPPPGFPPDIPGLELAGDVVEVGARVTRFSPGDRVMAVVGGAAQAELALVDESVAIGVPEETSWVEAGGFPEAFTTAYDALFDQCELSVGDRLLVSGAAGGVGTAAVQLAAVCGAVVLASVRRPEARGELESLGATKAMDPDDVSAHGPYDAILELVGATSLAGAMRSLATGARVSVIGVSGGGGKLEVELLTLMGRRARISGSTLRARPLADKSLLARAIADKVVPLLASSKVRVPVASTFAIEDASDAYASFSKGGKLGKIVLVAPASGATR